MSGDRSWYGIPDFLSDDGPLPDPFADNARPRQAMRWRASRILRFTKRQARQRQWIRFTEIADRERARVPTSDYTGDHFSVQHAYNAFRAAILAGDFERAGRSRILYLHPASTKVRMTHERLASAVESYPPETIGSQYLGYCWLPRDLAIAWCERRNLSPGWITHQQRRIRRGPRQKDDREALAEMERLLKQGFSVRECALRAAKQMGLITDKNAHQTDSVVDRLRKKFAHGAIH